jgi:hypothetical protein
MKLVNEYTASPDFQKLGCGDGEGIFMAWLVVVLYPSPDVHQLF